MHASIGELNGDNKPEIVVPLYGSIGVSLFQNNSTSGSINFSPKVDFVSGGAFGRSIALGDADNDGKNDVLKAVLNAFVVVVPRTSSVNPCLTPH